MIWRTAKVEDQRKEFISAYLENTVSTSALCREFNISRKTAYKWISRFEENGFDGLVDRSRAPSIQPNKTSDELIEKILAVKNWQEKWGPKKILGFLENENILQLPSATTIGKILDEHGLVIPRKYRKRFPAKSAPLSHCEEPNDVWSIDFKGWFKTKDNVKCDPLTLTDAYSRYLLYCSKIPLNTTEYVWNVLVKSFREYGLPKYLRHDNGPPFATCGAGRLSRLSVNLIKSGVIPEWIEPGKPYQNGRHERMHLTLKQEAAFPSVLTLKEQQMKLIEFQQYFNFDRPHEALGQKTPSSKYKPSSRVWNEKERSVEYSDDFRVVRVRRSGQIGWRGGELFIGKTLQDEFVGLKEHENEDWGVYYGPVLLGYITDDNQLVHPMRKIRSLTRYRERVY